MKFDILIYAQLSSWIYLNEQDFKSQLGNIDAQFVAWIDEKSTNTQVAILKYNHKKIIIFRGTMAFSTDPREFFNDIKTDVDFKFEKYSFKDQQCKIHKGFLRAYRKVSEKILTHISPEDDIVITGHSLGGALTHICALDISNFKDHKIRCYTFGCPKIGNIDFKILCELNFRCLNVIHVSDPIPTCPPQIFGYSSLGHERFIGKNTCFIRTIKSHNIKNYINLIKEKLKKSKTISKKKFWNIIGKLLKGCIYE